jgi:hypothetical protein
MPWRKPPDPNQPHAFTARKYGTRLACRWCGGQTSDQIHNVPKRRLTDQ